MRGCGKTLPRASGVVLLYLNPVVLLLRTGQRNEPASQPHLARRVRSRGKSSGDGDFYNEKHRRKDTVKSWF